MGNIQDHLKNVERDEISSLDRSSSKQASSCDSREDVDGYFTDFLEEYSQSSYACQVCHN